MFQSFKQSLTHSRGELLSEAETGRYFKYEVVTQDKMEITQPVQLAEFSHQIESCDSYYNKEDET